MYLLAHYITRFSACACFAFDKSCHLEWYDAKQHPCIACVLWSVRESPCALVCSHTCSQKEASTLIKAWHTQVLKMLPHKASIVMELSRLTQKSRSPHSQGMQASCLWPRLVLCWTRITMVWTRYQSSSSHLPCTPGRALHDCHCRQSERCILPFLMRSCSAPRDCQQTCQCAARCQRKRDLKCRRSCLHFQGT